MFARSGELLTTRLREMTFAALLRQVRQFPCYGSRLSLQPMITVL